MQKTMTMTIDHEMDIGNFKSKLDEFVMSNVNFGM